MSLWKALTRRWDVAEHIRDAGDADAYLAAVAGENDPALLAAAQLAVGRAQDIHQFTRSHDHNCIVKDGENHAIRGRVASGSLIPPAPSVEGKTKMPSIAQIPVKARSATPDHGTVHWFDVSVERAKNGVLSEVVTVSPGLAGTILNRNPDNRPIRSKVNHYAADMIAGRWTFNGEPILISSDGLLNDGQHRLNALIDANISLPFLFVFGVSRDSRMTVDQGAARSAGDYLGMQGVQNAKAAASIARVVIAYELGDEKAFADASRITNAQIRARVLSDPGIGAAAAYAMHVHRYSQHLAAPALVGAAFYILNEVHPSDAKEYMDGVAIGEKLRRGQPAFAVRETLLNLGRGRKAGKLEAIFHGWNKFRRGGTMNVAKAAKSNNRFPALV